MARPPVIEKLAGTTIKLTFVSSGSIASPISSSLLDKNEQLVNSIAAASSGNGMYYALHTLPGSAQWMVNLWIAVVQANTYQERQFIRVRTMEVD